jgi:hypothetical protein
VVSGSAEVCVQEIIVNVGVFMRLSLYCEVCRLSHRVRSIFYLGHLWVIADHATEPFVLHAWLLRISQLKYGKIINNRIAA